MTIGHEATPTAQGGKALGITRPAFRLVVISDDADLLQGFIETSGMAVPAVEHGQRKQQAL